MLLNLLLSLWLQGMCAGFSASVAIGVPAQTLPHQVVGNVTSLKGEPLAGATVALKGTRNTSVITNSVGKFLLASPTRTPELHVSFAGYYDTTVVVPAAQEAFVVALRPINRYKQQLKKQVKSARKAWKKP